MPVSQVPCTAVDGGLEKAFLNALEQAGSDDTLVVFGSFYTVSTLLAC